MLNADSAMRFPKPENFHGPECKILRFWQGHSLARMQLGHTCFQ